MQGIQQNCLYQNDHQTMLHVSFTFSLSQCLIFIVLYLGLDQITFTTSWSCWTTHRNGLRWQQLWVASHMTNMKIITKVFTINTWFKWKACCPVSWLLEWGVLEQGNILNMQAGGLQHNGWFNMRCSYCITSGSNPQSYIPKPSHLTELPAAWETSWLHSIT